MWQVLINDPVENYSFINVQLKDKKNTSKNMLCDIMYRIWLKKQTLEDRFFIVLLENKYNRFQICEILDFSVYQFYKTRNRLKKSLREWFYS